MISDQLAPVWTPSAQQRCYRRILEAWAYPGRILRVVGMDAMEACLATLVDDTVSVHDRDSVVSGQTLRLCRGQGAAWEEALFCCADAALPAGEQVPNLGSLLRPDRSATLLLRVAGLHATGALRLRGPGIAETQSLGLTGVHHSWLQARSRWCARYPMGVDLMLLAGEYFCAIPRTTTIEGF